jgi:predicted metalloprotease
VRAPIASIAGLGLLVSLASNNAQASSQAQQLFLSTLATLRNQDPPVASVKARVLAAPRNETGCGNAGNGDAVAFYCQRDRTIYVSVNTLNSIAENFGQSAVRYLAAHELAHGRQHAVTGFAKDLVWSSVLDELQADCIAGSYLRNAYGYTPESAQGEAVRRFAYNIGDREYLHHDWHGNPRWRAAAVSRGMRTGNPARCLSSKRFNYGSLLESGAEMLRQWRKP